MPSIMGASGEVSMVDLREPAVAGSFYSDDPDLLAAEVDGYLDAATDQPLPPGVLVVPHAGYRYSGAVAGLAWGQARAHRASYGHAVMLGPAHRQPVFGLALPGVRSLATPLGTVAVDGPLCDRIVGLPQVCVDAAAHRFEHSIEVQLPFLQRALPGVPALALLVGQAEPAEVAAVIDAVWDADTLLVISTDLSHFLSLPQAEALDADTVRSLEQGDAGALTGDRACGCRPLAGLLASRRAGPLRCLARRTSADAGAPRDRVVGYAALVG